MLRLHRIAHRCEVRRFEAKRFAAADDAHKGGDGGKARGNEASSVAPLTTEASRFDEASKRRVVMYDTIISTSSSSTTTTATTTNATSSKSTGTGSKPSCSFQSSSRLTRLPDVCLLVHQCFLLAVNVAVPDAAAATAAAPV